MNRLVLGTLILSFILLMAVGCATTTRYDYSIHKPKVVYQEPSRQALSKSLRKTLNKKYVWAEEGTKGV